MKLISTCEQQFIENIVIKRQKRLDGRQFNESRTLEIVFGKERGCCMVIQGNTRTFAQVFCEVTEPKQSTPTEGVLHVNLELSGMSAPDAKSQSRTSEEYAESQRLLERCIRDSKCVDLESLCIVTGSKVWTIRVDIHALNDDGNLIESASIAGVAALAHFKRPDITVVGTDVTMHSIEEREPVALNLNHMPISVNLALYQQGAHILVDPTELEEKVAEGCYVIGMNAHQEICFAHRRGAFLLNENAVQRCEDAAVKHAQEVTQFIRKALEEDAYKRATNAPVGFTNLIESDTILGAKQPIAEFTLDSVKNVTESEVIDLEDKEEEIVDVPDDEPKTYAVKKSDAKKRAIHLLQEAETTVFEGGPSKWDISDEENDDQESRYDVGDPPEETPESEQVSKIKEEADESEEETVYVSSDQVKFCWRVWRTRWLDDTENKKLAKSCFGLAEACCRGIRPVTGCHIHKEEKFR